MWAPVDFAALAWLPKPGSRPYTQVEALFALQADYWHGRPASVSGFAGQWGWHRRRVRDFMEQVGVEIVGQVGRRPGQLRPSNGPANGPTNGPATAHQVFRDFGQIGDFENKSGPSNGPANVSEVAHTYQQDTKNEQDTTPPTPLGEQQEIKEYMRFAVLHCSTSNPAGLEAWLIRQGGLQESHLQQLQAWRQAHKLKEQSRARVAHDDEAADAAADEFFVKYQLNRAKSNVSTFMEAKSD
ncbi:MAG: hypothetical protein V1782_01430 [Pseudomonadota bacterium]